MLHLISSCYITLDWIWLRGKQVYGCLLLIHEAKQHYMTHHEVRYWHWVNFSIWFQYLCFCPMHLRDNLQCYWGKNDAATIKQDWLWNADKPSASIIRSIYPDMINHFASQSQTCQLLIWFQTLKGNCEKWCNLRSNWWASTSNLKFPFSDSIKYK